MKKNLQEKAKKFAPDKWLKILNDPFAVFTYDEDEEDVFYRTAISLLQNLSLDSFRLEIDEENLTITVWRKKRKI